VATSNKSTIQNCFVKCGHVKKNQEVSDVTEVNGSSEDDVMQNEDWVRLGASTTGVDFDAYVSVDQELMHVVCCVWKKCVVWWEVEVAWRGGRVMMIKVR
jgi:hypothetical protein